MRRLLLVFAVGILTAVPLAHAITNGEPDGTAHPYVGLVGLYDTSGTFVQRCSGTLVAPTVFLTAAHCAFADDGTPLADAQVWFDSVVAPGVVSSRIGGVRGTAIPHPQFQGLAALPDTNDIAVVVLDAPVRGVGLGALPPIGALDGSTKKGTSFTLVGYGNISKTESGDRTRRRASAGLGDLDGKSAAGFNLKTKQGNGGTFCFGDSGGPVLLGDTNVVVALSSLVKQSCKGASLSFRVDTPAAQAFLAPYVAAGE